MRPNFVKAIQIRSRRLVKMITTMGMILTQMKKKERKKTTEKTKWNKNQSLKTT